MNEGANSRAIFAPLDEEWRRSAACKGKPLSWWFPAEEGMHNNYSRARDVCASCTVVKECLASASNSSNTGMYGGMNPHERQHGVRVELHPRRLCPACGFYFRGVKSIRSTTYCCRACADEAKQARRLKAAS